MNKNINRQNMGDFSQIRKDAIKRAKEMQSRSTTEGINRAINPQRGITQGKSEPKKETKKLEKETNKKTDFNLLNMLGKDSEKLLLLILMFILFQDGADMGLVFALFYILS